MNIKSLILAEIKTKGQIEAKIIIKKTGFSRTYINRFFRELRDEGKIIAFGKTKGSTYVLADQESLNNTKKGILNFNETLDNKELNEDLFLNKIKKQTGIFLDLPKNVIGVLDFGFAEMLNNAIDHSHSSKITIKVERKLDEVNFWIIDYGVGVFNSVKKKFNLPDELTAIEHLLKGKQTSDPKRHSGQGIFFTSKLADSFTIISGNKRLRFIKSLDDIFIDEVKLFDGTKIFFSIKNDSQVLAKKIFDKFSSEEFDFNKTKIAIKLSKNNQGLVSRSEARRIMFGLDKFKEIILDFKDVDTVGQGFCDEVWRVWQNKYPKIKIEFVNVNENVEFMIKRSIA